ncbi:hypothetical protein, partial [Mesorhizobium sp. M8A.F.Ca.ET.213.01.1.1]|uniref:hypothetical protein n=1 Tax=Mesorhizobium sp. M8A.F.Ca.ET.213.01.1.1 TaxID=2563970 RepID=UPI001AEE38BA
MAKPFDRKIGRLGLIKRTQSSCDFELTEAIVGKSGIAICYSQDYVGEYKVRVALQCLRSEER